MKKFLLIFFVSINPFLLGSTEEEKVYLENIQGIALLGSSEVHVDTPVQGVKIIDLPLPGPLHVLEERLSGFFVQKDLTGSDIQEIKKIIGKFFADYYHPFVRVSIPIQSSKNAVLQLIVEEAKVGQVEVVGNKHFSSDSISKYLSTQESEPIDTKKMLRDINFINRNPFRRVDVIYSAGEFPGTTNITLSVEDRKTFRAYAGYDNTGVEPLGTGRLFGGCNWANVFNLDHIFSFQYTTNPSDFNEFQSITAHYTAPLPWKNTLVAYGGYAWIKAPKTPGCKSNNGQTAQLSSRYQVPLPSSNGLLHEFECGADWKWTNNELIFGGGGRIAKFTNLFQFELGYNLDYQTQITNTTFEIETYIGPGKWLPNQSEEDYMLLRTNSSPQYVYFRSSFSEIVKLPKGFSVWSFLRGQLATRNLLPSEQMGLGGYNTVRGYYERTFNVDNGLLLNLEFRSPTISFNKKHRHPLRHELTFLIFLDYGFGGNHQGDVVVEEGLKPTVWLAGVGPGMRWNFSTYFSLRYDWGVRINQNDFDVGSGFQRSHFSFIASY